MATLGDLIDDRYRLLRVLGVGGMGTVFEAEHVGLERRVALKMLSASDSSEAALRRFEREARATARLRGDHVVRVYDVDRLADGTMFIAMECLDGHDLGSECEARDVSREEILVWALQALEALAEAHAAGVVHRDLKPENIFLAQRGDARIVKLVDFGIAKLLDESPPDRTVNSSIMGTPRYMAPEQLRGSATDHRADIYALGVILYRVVSGGHFPYDAGPASLYAQAVLTAPPVPIGARRSDVPVELAAVIMRCLEQDPARRFESAAALTDALLKARAKMVAAAVGEAPTEVAPVRVNVTTPTRRGASRRVRYGLAVAFLASVSVLMAGIAHERRPVADAAAESATAATPKVRTPRGDATVGVGGADESVAMPRREPVAERVVSAAFGTGVASSHAAPSTPPAAAAPSATTPPAPQLTPRQRAIANAPALL